MKLAASFLIYIYHIVYFAVLGKVSELVIIDLQRMFGCLLT